MIKLNRRGIPLPQPGETLCHWKVVEILPDTKPQLYRVLCPRCAAESSKTRQHMERCTTCENCRRRMKRKIGEYQ